MIAIDGSFCFAGFEPSKTVEYASSTGSMMLEQGHLIPRCPRTVARETSSASTQLKERKFKEPGIV